MKDLLEMFKGTDQAVKVLLNTSYQSLKTQNLPLENSSCDHRNIDSANEPLRTWRQLLGQSVFFAINLAQFHELRHVYALLN